MGCSHCLQRFSTSESCPFPIPSWFPSIQAPTNSAIPSSQCFLLQSLHRCLYMLHCYGSDCFSVLKAFPYSLPCLDEVLQLSIHPNHRYRSTPTIFYSPNIIFSTSILSNRFATSLCLVVAYPLWGFTASFVNNRSWLFHRWVANFRGGNG